LARQISQANGGILHFTYSHVLNGFAATLPSQAVEGVAVTRMWRLLCLIRK
jgi:hypothetical protein